ncbi:MAG: ABC transporter permease [Spirochaetaceae bacterium]|jgi:simple sugar transport system permease protein|nr:ABC transporter permease [Spirochaetaceae bacterium]
MRIDEAHQNPLKKYFFLLLHPEARVGAVRYLISFLGVLAVGSLLISAQGENARAAAGYIVEGAFGSLRAFGNTLRWATPCLLTGAASIIAFKSGVINLGIEGQMFIGALTASVLGYALNLPPPFHAALCVFAAGIAGMIWVLIPAFMRLLFSINEYVTTMMMNFIATLFCDFVVLWIILPAVQRTTVTLQTPPIARTARLTTLVPGTSASTGFIIALLVCLGVFVFYKYTIKGYELKQVGENLKFAKTGGVNVKKSFIAIFLLSGFVAGLCGGVEVNGGYYRYVSNFSLTMGWEGILIANISGHNPIAMVFVAFIWGALKTGSMSMERATSLNRLTVNLLQLIFVLFVSVDYEGIFNYFKKKAGLRRLAKQREAVKEAT